MVENGVIGCIFNSSLNLDQYIIFNESYIQNDLACHYVL